MTVSLQGETGVVNQGADGAEEVSSLLLEEEESDFELTVAQKLLYGLGGLVETIQGSIFFAFFLVYYNQGLGLSSMLVGVSASVALLFDSLMEPAIGMLTDTWRSRRFGNRHGFLVAGCLPTALGMALLYNAPRGLSDVPLFLWATGSLVLMRTSASVFTVPHMALGADLATDYHQRTNIMTYPGVIGMGVGPPLAGLGMMLFMTPSPGHPSGASNPDNYPKAVAFYSCIVLVAGLTCAFGLRGFIPALNARRAASDPPRRSFWVQFRGFFGDIYDSFKHRSFRAIALATLFNNMTLGISGTINMLVWIHFWGLSAQKTSFVPFSFPFAAALAALILVLCKRLSIEKKAIAMGSILFIWIGGAGALFLGLTGVLPQVHGEEVLPYLIGFSFICNTGNVVNIIITQSMIADVAEEMKITHGKRREGVLYAVRTFAGKVASAGGHLVAGVGLTIIRFPSEAKMGSIDSSMRTKLGIMSLVASQSWLLIAFIALSRYDLTAEKLRRAKTMHSDYD